jgi:hypothetical protein
MDKYVLLKVFHVSSITIIASHLSIDINVDIGIHDSCSSFLVEA